MKIYFQFKRDLAKFLTNIEFKQKIYQTDYVIEYLREALHCRCRIHNTTQPPKFFVTPC